MRLTKIQLLRLYFSIICLFWSMSGYAHLGADEGTAQRDADQLQATHRVTNQPLYRIHLITQPSGTLVKEFVGFHGRVFAITWSGQQRPNLKLLLGEEGFNTFQTAARSPHFDHKHIAAVGPDLIIESAGHQRMLFGRAYISSLIPNGMSLDDIQ